MEESYVAGALGLPTARWFSRASFAVLVTFRDLGFKGVDDVVPASQAADNVLAGF